MNTPKSYKIGYKLFEMREDGKLFPLFISKGKETVMNKWLPAENNPTKGYSARPGWHISMTVPDAPHLRGYDGGRMDLWRIYARRATTVVTTNRENRMNSQLNL